MNGRHVRPDPRSSALARPGWSIGLVALAALAGVVAVGAWWGAVAGLLAGLAGARWLARRPTAAQAARQRRFRAQLPFALDLVAAALRAGAPPDAAARWVADASGDVVGERLHEVQRALRAGVAAVQAWGLLGDGGGERVARAAQRSAHSGAALAGAFARVADDLRADAVQAAEARARTAGVLVVLPLGLCFLPAFVLTGLVPVIVAVVAGVLTTPPP